MIKFIRVILHGILKNILNNNKTGRTEEIRFFHPSGKTLPNGSHYQKGGFIRECQQNANAFDIPGMKCNNSGGIIIFSQGTTSGLSIENRLMIRIKNAVEAFSGYSQRNQKSSDLRDIYNIDFQCGTNMDASYYFIGNFFRGEYLDGSGKIYNSSSLSLAFPCISPTVLNRFAEYISNYLIKDSLIVKDLNCGKIYLSHCQKRPL